jgi:uncharacterized protein YnzC (UPF0291/DUF896 family)
MMSIAQVSRCRGFLRINEYGTRSKEGMNRRLLGSYTDRIEASLLRKEYKKINRAQFEKMLETYAEPN